MKTDQIFELYEFIYDTCFAGRVEMPPLQVYTDDDLDDYFGFFTPDEFFIAFVKPNHRNWKQVLDTLVHELTHVDQIIANGRTNPECYHDDWFDRHFKRNMKKMRKAFK